MTCIVGLVHEDKVYIGGDSASVAGYGLTVRADEKVFINGDFIMGFTSSFRMGQLLRYSLKPPKYHPDVDLNEYMVNDFIDSVRNCLKSGGFAEKDKEVERTGTFLVGSNGKLFKISSDNQVGIPFLSFDSCGCGEDIALGSMYSNSSLPPEERILQALEAAEQFSARVRRPFIVKCLGKNTVKPELPLPAPDWIEKGYPKRDV
jgi:ATP-dependent protease HslVU (ClpYQ) peptidase subunit